MGGGEDPSGPDDASPTEVEARRVLQADLPRPRVGVGLLTPYDTITGKALPPAAGCGET